MVEFSHGNVHRRDWQHAGKKRSAYEYSFTYTKDSVTRRARGQAATRAEALEAMEARKAELGKEPEAAALAPVTLNEYADRWLVEIACRSSRARSTRTEACSRIMSGRRSVRSRCRRSRAAR
jgi:hypothetical protein